MDPKKLKRRILVFVIFFAVILGNTIRTKALDTIRAVDALQLFACGMMFGILFVNIIMLVRLKSKEGK